MLIHGCFLEFPERCTTLALALHMQWWPRRDGNNLVQMHHMLVKVKQMLSFIVIYSVFEPELQLVHSQGTAVVGIDAIEKGKQPLHVTATGDRRRAHHGITRKWGRRMHC